MNIYNPFESDLEQNPEEMPVYNKLSDIYADIQEELCSKQSTLMSKLKNSFTSIYSDLLPSHYVIINHVVSLSDFAFFKQVTGKQVNMATENGVIVLVKETYLGEKIFINGLCGEEFIFQAKGTVSNELHSQSMKENEQEKNYKNSISEVIQLANDSLALNKLFGGTILIYSNISQAVENYKEEVLLGIFFSILIINSHLKELSRHQIYERLFQSKLFSHQFLKTQFAPFFKGQVSVIENKLNEMTNEYETLTDNFKLPKNEKLLFFNLGLSHKELNNMKKHKNNEIQKFKSISEKQSQQLENPMRIKLYNLKSGKLSLSQFFCSLNKLKKSFKTSYSTVIQEIEDQIEQIAQLMNKKITQLIIVDDYLVLSCGNYEIHEKIRALRKHMNNKLTQQNPQAIQRRFSSKGTDKVLFSAVPSLSIAILNPEGEMWFK